MRKLILPLVLIVSVVALSGCLLWQKPFDVVVEPMSGHPPLEVTIAMRGGTTYLIEVGLVTGNAFDVLWSFQTAKTEERIILRTIPADIRVTDEAGNSGTFHITLSNSPPVFVGWPRVNGRDPNYNGRYLVDLQRYFFDFNYHEVPGLWPGDPGQRFGVMDPDGDEWRITDVEVLWYGDGFPNGREVTVYAPPYIPGVYHATRHASSRSQSDVVENAFVLYPPYQGRYIQTQSMTTCYAPEWTYLWYPCENKPIPASGPAPLRMTVTVQDEFGAQAERTYEFTLNATGCHVAR